MNKVHRCFPDFRQRLHKTNFRNETSPKPNTEAHTSGNARNGYNPNFTAQMTNGYPGTNPTNSHNSNLEAQPANGYSSTSNAPKATQANGVIRFTSPANLKSIGLSLAIGMGAALVVTALITGLAYLTVSQYKHAPEFDKLMRSIYVTGLTSDATVAQFTSGSVIAVFVNLLVKLTGRQLSHHLQFSVRQHHNSRERAIPIPRKQRPTT